MSPIGQPVRPVYLDHHATTPVDPRVMDEMLPYFCEVFGNPSSSDHIYGAEASRAVETARESVAQSINARPREVIFTSGATESDNLAILGLAGQRQTDKNHIITCVTEHSAVLDCCRFLERRGFQISYLPVDSLGRLDPNLIRQAIRPETLVISVMAANNEIGTLAPLAEIGEIAKAHGVVFHTDAAQAVGHVPIDVQALHIDLLSLSAHKIYGPKGIGALYVRSQGHAIRLQEQIHGGGHERRMRSGTLNVPGIVGLGEALRIARREMDSEAERLGTLRDRLWNTLRSQIPGVSLNGDPAARLPHNLSVSFGEVDAHALTMALRPHVAASTGSACTTMSMEPSHVISALGLGDKRAHSTVRFGLGRSNTTEEIDLAAQHIVASVARLRNLS